MRHLAAAVATLLCATSAAAEEDVDLVGTWYVLVHYTDSDSANPDTLRWDDRLWVFEKQGSRLVWTEYPIVVFGDEEGRFERGAHGQQRVLAAWEPNATQRAQIAGGLEFNTRGAKTKSLRRSKKDGRWQSAAPATAHSANAIAYHETWTILEPTGRPTFIRDDVLGSGRAEAMNGRTLYATEDVSPAGSTLRGSFARDESRRGTFRMTRSGDAKSVGTKRTQRERLRLMLGIDDANAVAAFDEDGNPTAPGGAPEGEPSPESDVAPESEPDDGASGGD